MELPVACCPLTKTTIWRWPATRMSSLLMLQADLCATLRRNSFLEKKTTFLLVYAPKFAQNVLFETDARVIMKKSHLCCRFWNAALRRTWPHHAFIWSLGHVCCRTTLKWINYSWLTVATSFYACQWISATIFIFYSNQLMFKWSNLSKKIYDFRNALFLFPPFQQSTSQTNQVSETTVTLDTTNIPTGSGPSRRWVLPLLSSPIPLCVLWPFDSTLSFSHIHRQLTSR